jgi:hypothetical protein
MPVYCAEGMRHFDPTGAVVFRVEYLTEREMKWNVALVHCAEAIGLLILICVLIAKVRGPVNQQRRAHMWIPLGLKEVVGLFVLIRLLIARVRGAHMCWRVQVLGSTPIGGVDLTLRGGRGTCLYHPRADCQDYSFSTPPGGGLAQVCSCVSCSHALHCCPRCKSSSTPPY